MIKILQNTLNKLKYLCDKYCVEDKICDELKRREVDPEDIDNKYNNQVNKSKISR